VLIYGEVNILDFYFSSLMPTSLEANFISDKPNGCVLLSQLNDRPQIKKWIERNTNSDNKVKLFIDSGAFTCWTKGATIDIDEYILYLNSISDDVSCYASLDVIPGKSTSATIPTVQESEEASDKSWENYLYMRSKVKHPDKLLYTFHIGEDYYYLKKALSYSDTFGKVGYLGLGGLVGKTNSDIIDFLEKCFEIIKHSSHPNIRVHTFGMTRFTTLTQFPIYSTDSTAYIQKGAFGTIMLGTTVLPISSNSELENKNIVNRNPAVKEALYKELNKRGMTLEELQTSRDKRVLWNCMSYYDLMETYKYVPQIKPVTTELW
jgi:hypothetical protein